jgi:predicted RND superfamily exporter protein
MGIFSIHLDLGTAMLASIILGTGVDYAVHFLAGWSSRSSLDEAARHAAAGTGDAIWTNAVTVALGFGVLTMGAARPLQNVGGLTAAAMIVAATATFIVIPLLARRLRYRAGGAGFSFDADTAAAATAAETIPEPSSASGRER